MGDVRTFLAGQQLAAEYRQGALDTLRKQLMLLSDDDVEMVDYVVMRIGQVIEVNPLQPPRPDGVSEADEKAMVTPGQAACTQFLHALILAYSELWYARRAAG